MQIEILDEDRLRVWCECIRMPADAVDVLARVATAIRQDAGLMEAFAAYHEKTSLKNDWMREWKDLPFDESVEQKLGQDTSLFYLLAYMAALPYAQRAYEQRGINPQVFDDTMQDISIWFKNNSALCDHWRFSQFAWIWRHLAGEMFRLGRLQFMLIPYDEHVIAFRSRMDGEIRLFCGTEMALRADGYAEGAGGITTTEPPWFAIYEEREEGWRGNLVSPYGYVLREPFFLPRSEWEIALQSGDWILDLHIPRGESLTEEECRESLRQVFDFFATQYPDRPFKAIFCHTWFFTPQLQSLLPPTSSIVRFQREFYLYPYPGGVGFLWSFVFGEQYPDPKTAPRDTSLRRAVLDWLAAGRELFDLPGIMLHSPKEWGTQPYMTRWDDDK
jgi:hypothetical protein